MFKTIVDSVLEHPKIAELIRLVREIHAAVTTDNEHIT